MHDKGLAVVTFIGRLYPRKQLGGHVDKKFNSDFYVTAATVIPVLYVAIETQLPFVSRATSWLAYYSWRNARENGPRALRVMARIATPAILIAASVVFVISVIAETESVLALLSQVGYPQRSRLIVLYSTIALLILAVLTPSWSIWLFIVQVRELSSRGAVSGITQSLQQIFEDSRSDSSSKRPGSQNADLVGDTVSSSGVIVRVRVPALRGWTLQAVSSASCGLPMGSPVSMAASS